MAQSEQDHNDMFAESPPARSSTHPSDPLLSSYTAADVMARQKASAARSQAREDESRHAESSRNSAQAQRAILARLDASAENFQLGQAPGAALAGQNDLFGASSTQAGRSCGVDVEVSPELLSIARMDTERLDVRMRDDVEGDQQGVFPGQLTNINRALVNGRYTVEDIAAAWACTRDFLRDKYGDRLTLYRAEAPPEKRHRDTKLVYMADRQVAQMFAHNGRTVDAYTVGVDDIIGLNVQHNGYYEFIVRRQDRQTGVEAHGTAQGKDAMRERPEDAGALQAGRPASPAPAGQNAARGKMRQADELSIAASPDHEEWDRAVYKDVAIDFEANSRAATVLDIISAHPRSSQARQGQPGSGEALLLIACSGAKLAGTHRALDLYQGALFEVLRKWMPAANAPHIYIISAKHGLVDAGTRVDSYEQPMDEARQQELIRSGVDVGAFSGKHFSEVFVAGGPMYRTVAQAYIAQLKQAGVVGRESKVYATSGRIGEQRGQLGHYLRALEGAATSGEKRTAARRTRPGG